MGRDRSPYIEEPDLEARPHRQVPVRERRIRAALLVLGLSQLILAAWQGFAPGNFFRTFAAFGRANDHYVRDVATFYAALGVVLLLAVRRPRWRLSILAFATLQYLLHFVNHVVDIGKSDPSWIGPADAISIGLGAVLFGLTFLVVARSRRRGG